MAIGKKVFKSIYIHLSYINLLDEACKSYSEQAFNIINKDINIRVNVLKISLDGSFVSALNYLNFFEDPFPQLLESWKINLISKEIVYRSYKNSLNPPILHRKELLINNNHPEYIKFSDLSKTAETLGLFEDTSIIGFQKQWYNRINDKGYKLDGYQFLPIGNTEDDITNLDATESNEKQHDLSEKNIERHRTALSRYNFSAPIQTLMRFGFLDGQYELFDYGCGHGDDVRGLIENNITATGWDPFFATNEKRTKAELVNLGFVINVIEDLDERIEALKGAYSLAEKLLVIGVMLPNQKTIGEPYRDGILTKRNTFQKFFAPQELKQFVKDNLGEEAISVAPGIFFVFKDKDFEQQFILNRSRARNSILRISRVPREKPIKIKRNRKQEKYDANEELLEKLWLSWLELGREPKADEIEFVNEIKESFGTIGQALSFLLWFHDKALVEEASKIRKDDLLVFLALEEFHLRKAYKELEKSLQRDLKYYFGSPTEARKQAKELLFQIADNDKLVEISNLAQSEGLGWKDEKSLQLHSSLIERLPPLLRVYVGCANQLIGDVDSADLVKIHLYSGKLSLMKFDNFFGSALPRMLERVKINFRSQQIEVFDYSDPYIPPYLFRKSRFINEEMVEYAKQIDFEEKLDELNIFDTSGHGPSPEFFDKKIDEIRKHIEGFKILDSKKIPDIDQACGDNFCYRDFIECGETQKENQIQNIPKQPVTYNAIYALATKLLDPVIEYYGDIILTYGFCSGDLAREIPGRIAPKLDQHASHELNRKGNYICDRLGAAVDFIIEHENMFDVAKWINDNLSYDRMYIYDVKKPIHVSYNEICKKEVVQMVNKNGKLIPKIIKF